jgi:hypothetical protein
LTTRYSFSGEREEGTHFTLNKAAEEVLADANPTEQDLLGMVLVWRIAQKSSSRRFNQRVHQSKTIPRACLPSDPTSRCIKPKNLPVKEADHERIPSTNSNPTNDNYKYVFSINIGSTKHTSSILIIF